jgi:Lrp/AsnC family leucine-responsive transcriptional regulator
MTDIFSSFFQNAEMQKKPRISGLDWQILAALRSNARQQISGLAKQLGRSRSTIAEHLKSLKDRGVIRGFTVDIDEDQLGVGITAFVRLQADSSDHRKIVAAVDQLPEVAECHVLTGNDLLLIKVVARDMPHLRALVDGFTAWGATTTDVVFSTIKPHLAITPALRNSLERK